jgi:hypothetical protein
MQAGEKSTAIRFYLISSTLQTGTPRAVGRVLHGRSLWLFGLVVIVEG